MASVNEHICSAAGLIASQAAAGGVMLTVVHELVSSISGQACTACVAAHTCASSMFTCIVNQPGTADCRCTAGARATACWPRRCWPL
jgi:hypothetical protein